MFEKASSVDGAFLICAETQTGDRSRGSGDDEGGAVGLQYSGLDAVGVVRTDGAEDHTALGMAVAAPCGEDGHASIHPAGQDMRDVVGLRRDDDQQLAVVAGEAENDRVDQLRGRKDRDHGIERILDTAVDDSRQRNDHRIGKQDDAADNR